MLTRPITLRLGFNGNYVCSCIINLICDTNISIFSLKWKIKSNATKLIWNTWKTYISITWNENQTTVPRKHGMASFHSKQQYTISTKQKHYHCLCQINKSLGLSDVT